MGRWRVAFFIQPRDWLAGYTYQWRKKKEKQNCKEIKEENINFSVGDLVIVMNHGDAWTHRTHIISLKVNENAAKIKWESTGKCDYIEITDLKTNSEVETSQRKQKGTKFLYSLPLDVGKNRKKQSTLATDDNPSDQVQVGNKFYSIKNMSKLCAEGAIKNLLSMLNYSQSNMTCSGICATLRFLY
jgi:hypothetical protein